MKYLFLILTFMIMSKIVQGQTKNDSFLQNLLLKSKDVHLQKVMKRPDKYRVQIIYTQMERDEYNEPAFKNYYYNVNPYCYFNPASTVKMPLAFLALEKLHQTDWPGVNKKTPMLIDSNETWQTSAYEDETAESGLPSIAQYIKKIFLVSDNDAYNRLYQFLGQQTINRALHQKGYPDVRITKQFLGLNMEENRYSNGIRFIDKEGNILFHQPPAYNADSFDFSHAIKLGKGHWDAQGDLINIPMDFTRQNNISLEDLQQIAQSVLFPESVSQQQQFDLTPEDYRFLYRYMSQYPSETNYPKYDSSTYYDSYVKFFFRGEKLPDYLRIFNKAGWAYGFLSDVAYVADFKNRIEYMLSAVVYVNSDEILNNNQYDYDTIGYPFLRAVGETIYQYELSRPRRYSPDLSRFEVTYEKRDPADCRPTIKKVDN